MTWVKLDDAFPTNPKIVRLSDAAFRLYVTALCHAAQHLTDGVVVVPGLVKAKAVAVPELVKGGLFDETKRGLEVHDFLEFNPSRAAVLEVREKKREAGAIGGKRSAESRKKARAKGKQNVKQASSKVLKHSAQHDGSEKFNSRPVPSPPSPTGNEEVSSEGAATGLVSGTRSGFGSGRDPFDPAAPEPVRTAARKRLALESWDEEAAGRLQRGEQELPPRPTPFHPAKCYGPDSRNDERERLLLWEGGDDEAFTRQVERKPGKFGVEYRG